MTDMEELYHCYLACIPLAADMSNRMLLLLAVVANHYASTLSANTDQQIFNGFSTANLKLDGQASVTGHAIRLTQGISSEQGSAFYSKPLNFSSDNASAGDGGASFSTTFVFAITTDATMDLLETYGLTFVLSSTMELHHMYNSSGQYIVPPGIVGNNSKIDDQFFFAVEFSGNDENHIDIEVKSVVFVDSLIKNFYRSNSKFESSELSSGKPMQVWVEYDSQLQKLNITLEEFDEFHMTKPQSLPQFSFSVNLSSLISDSDFVYAGFSAIGQTNCSHYVIGWSFMLNGKAPLLNKIALNQVLASLPVENKQKQNHISNNKHMGMGIPLSVLLPTASLVTVALVVFIVLVSYNIKSWMKGKFGHGMYEIECGMPSFTYKELSSATSRFNKKMILGEGGFGKVYKGVLGLSKQSIAIKRVSPESKQGMKEFMAEIAILGHLRHRNLVQLIGYCLHKQELLLVYDYMPNGSLDSHLHKTDKPILVWAQRICIIKGVASGLLYLHEDWEQVVIHRDVKTSNILLDDEMNGRLGDFGLARLHNHESDAHTTHVAGTWGYIAPELGRHGKATKATDVYAFGIFLLEVVSGKRPIEVKADGETLLIADWVLNAWQSGSIIDVVDTRLPEEYEPEELELVLKLGLICTHSLPKKRPCMRLVMQYLLKDTPFPDFLPSFLATDANTEEDFNEQVLSCPSVATSITGLSGGR
ncbi:hypothetical protein PAHAL_3G434000 [Panicum hallii]|uniref:non-specific serine/threonine protein kinase n=1 Tax=Panicum hallii TaxID=206008 RepID=A0A2S3HEH1_9POAL|nr:L-type lectin-domain containing receptor kinase IV.1-like [Panicum hallii]PAN21315.1 hypothetical protein PAHAL_3G434000 [Panicum hallii]